MAREAEWRVDGHVVRGRLHLPEKGDARGVLVKLHGFATESREFGDAPELLTARGWGVLTFDRRGHGTSEGPRGVVSRAEALRDLRGALRWLESDSDTKDLPLGLIGHSMGAAFTVLALGQMPEFYAAALIAPMSRTRDEIGTLEFAGYNVARRLSRFKESIGLGPLVVPYKNRYRDLFLDEEAARRAEDLDFLQRTVSLANYDELLAIDAPAWATHVKQPTLVVLGRHDRAIQSKSSLEVFNALAGPKELVTLECGHSMFLDCAREELVDQLDRWFGEHLPG